MKKVLITILIIVVASLFFRAISRENNTDNIVSEITQATSTIPETVTSTTTPSVSVSTSTTKTVRANKDPWSILQSYLQAVKAHDIEKVKSLSHQQSDQCRDPKRQQECFEMMDTVYTLGVGFKKEDFTESWSDEKQLILSTPYRHYKDSDFVGYERGIIYFTKVNGEYKILSYNPTDGVYIVLQGKTAQDPMYEIRLKEMSKDSDKDSLTDEREMCAGQYTESPCVKTNHIRRDSDEDGWWDSIEMFFYPVR